MVVNWCFWSKLVLILTVKDALRGNTVFLMIVTGGVSGLLGIWSLEFRRVLFRSYIMRNAGLEETQVGIKIAGRNINNLRYAGDTTLMAGKSHGLMSLADYSPGDRRESDTTEAT